MRNYVLLMDISDKKLGKDILSQLKKIFDRNTIIKDGDLTYFSFAGRDIPGIQDILKNIINLNLNEFIESDFIALFYTRDEDPDWVHQLMILGMDTTIVQDLKNRISITTHENILSELFNFDFVKMEK